GTFQGALWFVLYHQPVAFDAVAGCGDGIYVALYAWLAGIYLACSAPTRHYHHSRCHAGAHAAGHTLSFAAWIRQNTCHCSDHRRRSRAACGSASWRIGHIYMGVTAMAQASIRTRDTGPAAGSARRAMRQCGRQTLPGGGVAHAEQGSSAESSDTT